jgi:polyisoprenoid-binding protein YceI
MSPHSATRRLGATLAALPLTLTLALALTAALGLHARAAAGADNYVIDTKGGHASINFRVKHLAYSWLYGRFNDFSGTFTYDEENPSNSTVQIEIKTASVDSNNAERDKHLRNKDFLDVEKFPTATFKSTAYKETGFNTSELSGDFTLKGVTKPITFKVERIGNGPDPWGGYRRGFLAETKIALKDYGINFDLGPAARNVELTLAIEGIRK